MIYKINYAADIVLVTGDRNWDDRQEIYNWLDHFKDIKLIVEGTAQGADIMAEEWATSRETPYLGVPAKWQSQARAAGPIRNSAMLTWLEIVISGFKIWKVKYECSVQVLAFHENIKKSKGTIDMMKKADKAGYDVYLVDKQ